jgi:TatD DNase family protein
MKAFDGDRAQVLERADRAGLTHIITVGIDLDSSCKAVSMAEGRDGHLIIHERESHDEVFACLKGFGKRDRNGVIHCFSGDADLAKHFIDLGYYISIPGTVTYAKASSVRQVAGTIPLDRLLMETDAPFLAPVPKRGRRNEPAFVGFTAREISRIRKMDFELLARTTTQNAKRLFNIP